MYSSDLRQVTSSIIAPIRAISLLDADWKCLHHEQWENQHHEFFAKSTSYCKSTIVKCQTTTKIKNQNNPKIQPPIHWILETTTKELIGRFSLQIISSDFKHGILFIDIESSPLGLELTPIISQIITSIFLSLSVDTQKIIPLSKRSELPLQTMPALVSTASASLSDSWLPTLNIFKSYDIDQFSWLESDHGKSALEKLSWLKKRVQRIQSIETSHTKPDKTNWIFSILTWGRRKRNREPMVHPLTQIRKSRN